jgi:hypothetical protein
MTTITLVSAGSATTTSFSTDDYNNIAGDPFFLAPGAHTLLVADSGRLETNGTAIAARNPSGPSYLPTASFTFTATINGIVAASGIDSFGIDLSNTRSTTANKITIGKTGAVGGDNTAIYASALTNIDNNGSISSNGVSGDPETGKAIVIDGFAPGSTIKPASTTTINNNLGAIIDGAVYGIEHNPLGKLVVNNKGFLIGAESTFQDDGAGAAILSYEGTVVLTNEINSVVSGTVRTGWLNSAVTNKGLINGTIRAHMATEQSADESSGLTGFIDYNRDGTPDHLSLTDKHLNNVTELAITVTNTGTIDGTDNWWTDDVTHAPIEVALDLSNGKDKVVNSGLIFGAIATRDGSDVLDNAITGKIYGDVSLGGNTFYDGINAYSADADILTNKGFIDGFVRTDNGKDLVTNNGEITGFLETGTGDYFAANDLGEDADTLVNTGIVRGYTWMGLGDDTVTNSGLLADGLDTSAWAPAVWDGTAYTFQNNLSPLTKDFDNDKDKVTNTGTIRNYLSTGHGADTVINSGTITGSLDTGVYATRGRSSRPNDPFAAVDQSVFQADDNDIVTNTGSVQGEIWTGLGADTVTNSGFTRAIYTSSSYLDNNGNPRIFTDQDDPNITVTSTLPIDAGNFDKDIVTNSGTVQDEIWTGVGDDKITNLAAGKILNSGIFADAGADTIINAGYVNGDVHGGANNDTITNTGVITQSVYLGSDGGETNKLINSKTINGNVAGDYGPTGDVAAEGTNTIENSGVIIGNVLLGGGTDVVKNLGAGHIEGLITLGAGNDTFIGNASAEHIIDGDGGDTYIFGAGNDTMQYLALSLSQDVDGDTDTIDGGLGTDVIDFSTLTVGSSVNLSNLAAQTITFTGLNAHTDNLKNFEIVFTGSGADSIIGTAGINYINAGDGINSITGGGGQDVMRGGTDADTFVFNLITDSVVGMADIIGDFDALEDKFDIDFATVQVTSSGTFTTGTLLNAQWHSTIVGGNTIVELNTDADAAADFAIFLTGAHIITDTNFV